MRNLNEIIDAGRTLAELQAEATLRGIATAGVRKEALRQLVAAHEMARMGGTPPVPPVPPVPRVPPTIPGTPPVPVVPLVPTTPLTITTASPLRVGRRGEQYDVRITATGGTGRKNWTVEDLPDGLHWIRRTSNSVSILGRPREDGTFHPRVTVDDDTGVPCTQVFDMTIRDNPGADHDYSWLRTVASWILGGIVVFILALIAIFVIVRLGHWLNDNFDMSWSSSDRDDSSTPNTPAKATLAPGNGGGKLTIGGLEINNDGQYNNGIKLGEIRPDVPAGYMVIGDATVNGHAPDQDPTTGQIVVLFKPATVIGTNESSLQRISTTSWQQAVKVKATEMRLKGCMGGCADVTKVYK